MLVAVGPMLGVLDCISVMYSIGESVLTVELGTSLWICMSFFDEVAVSTDNSPVGLRTVGMGVVNRSVPPCDHVGFCEALAGNMSNIESFDG
jgi:hypothetical protein